MCQTLALASTIVSSDSSSACMSASLSPSTSASSSSLSRHPPHRPVSRQSVSASSSSAGMSACQFVDIDLRQLVTSCFGLLFVGQCFGKVSRPPASLSASCRNRPPPACHQVSRSQDLLQERQPCSVDNSRKNWMFASRQTVKTSVQFTTCEVHMYILYIYKSLTPVYCHKPWVSGGGDEKYRKKMFAGPEKTK